MLGIINCISEKEPKRLQAVSVIIDKLIGILSSLFRMKAYNNRELKKRLVPNINIEYAVKNLRKPQSIGEFIPPYKSSILIFDKTIKPFIFMYHSIFNINNLYNI